MTPTATVAWIILIAQAVSPPAGPLPASPARIVTIAPNAAEIICALEACDLIVGVDRFCVYPPELASRPRIGGLYDPDLERIAALRPDVVVLRGQSRELEHLCRERNIRVFHDRTDRLADIERNILELGRLLNRETKAEALAAEFRTRLEFIAARVKNRPRPRVFVCVSSQPDKLSNLLTSGRGTFLDEMITHAGGINLFGHIDMMYPQVSTEEILARQPDVILDLMPEAQDTDALRARVRAQWQAIGPTPATRHERVYVLCDDHALIPSPRYTDIIEAVSRLLHPEAWAPPPRAAGP